MERKEKAFTIQDYRDSDHRKQVVSLWRQVFNYTGARNVPETSIENKLKAADNLFFVALLNGQVCGTVMAGYDGHRGWIYSLAVDPDFRGYGLGSRLLRHAEAALGRLGCPKINLQVMPDNTGVIEFYRKNGFAVEERVSMGKVIQ